ncbi:MAG: PQQ-dependent sugar dehydrogenase [Henriciella sp.]|nr:PQQ-dependent sugar dehydrogenase [Henriciella sp.]
MLDWKAVVAVLVGAVTGLIIGAAILAFNRDSEAAPFSFLFKVTDRIEREYNSLGTPADSGPPKEYFASSFTGIEGTVVSVPRAEIPGSGGGLAMIDGTAVVMTFRGRIYLTNESGDVEVSAVDVPDNGLEGYREVAASAEYGTPDFRHRFGRLRYNDIEYLSNESGRYLFITYTDFNAERACYSLVLSRLDLGEAEISDVTASADDWQDVFTSSPCLPLRAVNLAIQGEEAGGRITFGPDGRTAYLTIGEYGWNGWDSDGRTELSTRSLAQDPDADYGKVVSIDLQTGEATHFSIGHRNAQGITFDAEGRLWSVEHGPRGGDELNLITEENNYGWPVVSYGTEYDGAPLPNVQSVGRHDGYAEPMFSWLPSIGVSGLTSLDGFHDTWAGDVGAISLRAGTLFRIRTVEDRVVFTEAIEFGRKLRDIEQADDGELVVWTDAHEVIFLRPVSGSFGDQIVARYLDELSQTDPAFADIMSATFAQCSTCHAYNRDEHRIGPALALVYNSRIGAHPTFDQYSDALIAESGTWNEAKLTAYLRNPDEAVPGTSMVNPGITDDRVISEIIDVLKQMNSGEVEPGVD